MAPRRTRDVNDLVKVTIDEAIERNIDQWNDHLCALTQEPYLQDISWEVEGVDPGDSLIQLRVRGYVDLDDIGEE